MHCGRIPKASRGSFCAVCGSCARAGPALSKTQGARGGCESGQRVAAKEAGSGRSAAGRRRRTGRSWETRAREEEVRLLQTYCPAVRTRAYMPDALSGYCSFCIATLPVQCSHSCLAQKCMCAYVCMCVCSTGKHQAMRQPRSKATGPVHTATTGRMELRTQHTTQPTPQHTQGPRTDRGTNSNSSSKGINRAEQGGSNTGQQQTGLLAMTYSLHVSSLMTQSEYISEHGVYVSLLKHAHEQADALFDDTK